VNRREFLTLSVVPVVAPIPALAVSANGVCPQCSSTQRIELGLIVAAKQSDVDPALRRTYVVDSTMLVRCGSCNALYGELVG
jgi:hypothetical protein